MNSGTRPMACPNSCRNADTRCAPGVKPVPMPTKPSVWAVKSPKIAPTLELTQKFVKPLMLLWAGRLGALKKLGWPKVSRYCLSWEFVRKNAEAVLTFALELFVLIICIALIYQKQTSVKIVLAS